MTPAERLKVGQAMYEWEGDHKVKGQNMTSSIVRETIASSVQNGTVLEPSQLAILQSLAGDTVTRDKVLSDSDTSMMKNYKFLKEHGVDNPVPLLYKPTKSSDPTPTTMKKVFNEIDGLELYRNSLLSGGAKAARYIR